MLLNAGLAAIRICHLLLVALSDGATLLCCH
jgi:hypothetical protein